MEHNNNSIQATTVVAIRKGEHVAMAADGQVTFGNMIMKDNARKVRRLAGGKVLCGFAGSAADAFTLMDRFEAKLNSYNFNLERSAVELAKDWRNDRYLRKLEAMMIVADKTGMYVVSGNGDVIDPDDGVTAIGSGGPYALAAGRALVENTELTVREIAEKAINIAGSICIYTNKNIIIEEI